MITAACLCRNPRMDRQGKCLGCGTHNIVYERVVNEAADMVVAAYKKYSNPFIAWYDQRKMEKELTVKTWKFITRKDTKDYTVAEMITDAKIGANNGLDDWENRRDALRRKFAKPATIKVFWDHYYRKPEDKCHLATLLTMPKCPCKRAGQWPPPLMMEKVEEMIVSLIDSLEFLCLSVDTQEARAMDIAQHLVHFQLDKDMAAVAAAVGDE